jgi:hypothetical protein
MHCLTESRIMRRNHRFEYKDSRINVHVKTLVEAVVFFIVLTIIAHI